MGLAYHDKIQALQWDQKRGIAQILFLELDLVRSILPFRHQLLITPVCSSLYP
jgi:hypothetical protein